MAAPIEVVDGAARLIAVRCDECGSFTFPERRVCPGCASENVSRTLLPEIGALWTWTTQGFEPKSPPYLPDGPFEPYAVGYIEFPGLLRVEGRLTESDPSLLRIGMPLRVVARDHAGTPSYGFAPA